MDSRKKIPNKLRWSLRDFEAEKASLVFGSLINPIWCQAKIITIKSLKSGNKFMMEHFKDWMPLNKLKKKKTQNKTQTKDWMPLVKTDHRK